MSDDREEFEKDLNADETSLDQEAWALDEASEDRGRRFTAAMERLDAEVAGHEAKPIDPHPPQALRFGERLRAVIRHHRAQLTAPEAWTLEPIADAIDQDAIWAAQWHAQRFEQVNELRDQDLRRQVEEAVERLRRPELWGTQSPPPDILDAEPLLEELARIFGERAEKSDDELCCPVCGRPNALHGIACPSLLLPEHGMGYGMLTEDLEEHEPAAERREP